MKYEWLDEYCLAKRGAFDTGGRFRCIKIKSSKHRGGSAASDKILISQGDIPWLILAEQRIIICKKNICSHIIVLAEVQ